MYKKILVPLDGSALAAQALGHAEKIATESGAEIVLLHVIDTTRSSFMSAAGAAGGSSLPQGASTQAMHDPAFVSADPEIQSSTRCRQSWTASLSRCKDTILRSRAQRTLATLPTASSNL
ncbi:MAG: universal stress protein [Caldilineaceae bacterium]|nr:universal stress protein [Caldilineaceae bacterium]